MCPCVLEVAFVGPPADGVRYRVLDVTGVSDEVIYQALGRVLPSDFGVLPRCITRAPQKGGEHGERADLRKHPLPVLPTGVGQGV